MFLQFNGITIKEIILSNLNTTQLNRGFPGGSDDKDCVQCRRPTFDPWVGKIPWRRNWQPIPVSLPGESYGERNLGDYSPPVGHKESDMTQRLTLLLSMKSSSFKKTEIM